MSNYLSKSDVLYISKMFPESKSIINLENAEDVKPVFASLRPMANAGDKNAENVLEHLCKKGAQGEVLVTWTVLWTQDQEFAMKPTFDLMVSTYERITLTDDDLLGAYIAQKMGFVGIVKEKWPEVELKKKKESDNYAD